MAKIVFLKKGQTSSKKNYIPASIKLKKHIRFYQIILLIQALALSYLLYKR